MNASTALASIVANAGISRLALIGLAKNAGKTTAANHLLAALLQQGHYAPRELALTSLGLDGEAVDAMTGLPKPRYVPAAGVLVVTALELLRQAEREGARVEYLRKLPGRTALGPVALARILHPGQVVIAGPTLLRDVRSALDAAQALGARLGIIDGAINRTGAAAPAVSDACIVCTGASVAATPELVARRTVDVLRRLSVQRSSWADAYRKQAPRARVSLFMSDKREQPLISFSETDRIAEPGNEASWIARQAGENRHAVFFLHGALTEELSRALLAQQAGYNDAELVVEDGTKIFCHAVVLQRLAERGLDVRVAAPIRLLALTINPFTPEYTCTPALLLDALAKALPQDERLPIFDVVSGVGSIQKTKS